jgi:Fic family protein
MAGASERLEVILYFVAVRPRCFRGFRDGNTSALAAEFEELHRELGQITENHIRQLHRDLLQHSTKDERHRGAYKTHTNHVEAFDANGESIGVVFQTATPFDTPRLMTELVEWTQEHLDSKPLHPLMAIAIFVVVFLAIHPFQDGNGRLSRVLTTLLSLRAGYAYVSEWRSSMRCGGASFYMR